MSETVALSHGLPSSIREGEVLGGKYRLEKEIGRGAMGTVWSAVHLTLGQRVAIKLIAAEHAHGVEARQRFSNEAKAAARLRSRYVVQVYDDGETAWGNPYIVLEYLDGETLEQRLERERDMPLNDAVRVTRHVARALAKAHAHGIVHRDLKPANVFLTRNEDDEVGWIAKVLDFGIAKLEEQGVSSTTKTGTLLGTPLFMSPEQVRGASSVDARSDLYSLGVLFYNMMTGQYAFNADSFADVLVSICTAPLPDLRASAPWVPQSVGEWFQKACARDPNLRFQSADEMVEALDLALGVSSGAMSRQSSPEVKIDTLRGHAPPVAHALPRAADDSGDFARSATQVLVTDPLLLKSQPAPATRTLDPELTLPTTSRAPLFLGVALLVALLLGGGTFLALRSKTEPTVTASEPPLPSASAAVMAAPIPTVPPAVTASATVAATGAPTAIAEPPRVVAAPKSVPATSKPRPVAAAPRPQKPAEKPIPSPPPSPRNTTTDMGF